MMRLKIKLIRETNSENLRVRVSSHIDSVFVLTFVSILTLESLKLPGVTLELRLTGGGGGLTVVLTEERLAIFEIPGESQRAILECEQETSS